MFGLFVGHHSKEKIHGLHTEISHFITFFRKSHIQGSEIFISVTRATIFLSMSAQGHYLRQSFKLV